MHACLFKTHHVDLLDTVALQAAPSATAGAENDVDASSASEIFEPDVDAATPTAIGAQMAGLAGETGFADKLGEEDAKVTLACAFTLPLQGTGRTRGNQKIILFRSIPSVAVEAGALPSSSRE